MTKDELYEEIRKFHSQLIGLEELILFYYQARGLVKPDVWKALAFRDTELGEAMEILRAKDGDDWVRNNPEAKPGWDPDRFAEELGDAIMMLIMAGLAEGVFPVSALLEKMQRKLK